MDFETASPADFGRSLKGLGLNLLVRDVEALASFLKDVFAMEAFRLSADFAIMRYHGNVFQLHADHTYARHELLSVLPEAPPRGAGIELRLYHTDPDEAIARAAAHAHGSHVLKPPTDQPPHGLREAHILCENGYAWVPSRHLTTSTA